MEIIVIIIIIIINKVKIDKIKNIIRKLTKVRNNNRKDRTPLKEIKKNVTLPKTEAKIQVKAQRIRRYAKQTKNYLNAIKYLKAT